MGFLQRVEVEANFTLILGIYAFLVLIFLLKQLSWYYSGHFLSLLWLIRCTKHRDKWFPIAKFKGLRATQT